MIHSETSQKLNKEEYNKMLPSLRMRMLEIQYELRKNKIPVIFIFSGMIGAGKGHLVYKLNEWMDPRYIRTYAFWDETDEERQRPYFWRFFRKLPPRGEIGIFFDSWYRQLIRDSVLKRISNSDTMQQVDKIIKTERMLSHDGYLFVKLWFHLSKEEQKENLKNKRTRITKFTGEEKYIIKHYKKFTEITDNILKVTDSSFCPWHRISAADRRSAEIVLMETFIRSAEHHLAGINKIKTENHANEEKSSSKNKISIRSDQISASENQIPGKSNPPSPADRITINENKPISKVDLTLKLDEDTYTNELKKYMIRIDERSHRLHDDNKSLIAVFEGWDGAGKGSSIRRITRSMDARLYSVIPVAAPTDEEKNHHYLWRFWRHIPRSGYTTIYDRSWYGRVLVERVEQFAGEHEWMRAYDEINEFENSLSESGIRIVKFWVHIDPDEQLRRFKERENTPWKHYKITEDDWRNREKWSLYEEAVNDMIYKTNTESAPWHIIPGNDKKYARIEIMKAVAKAMK